MKIALVHDFLKEYGGAERVLETLHEIWPEAPIYTSFVDWEGLGPHGTRLKKWPIKTSWAQNIPYISILYSPLRFLAPYFFESFNLSEFEVVISSTNAYYAKGVLTKPETVHICYCHTPPRSLYGYPTQRNWQKNPFTRIYGQIVNHFLRKYDFLVSQRVDFFIANSREVQRRIAKFYRRDSTVIYPPVDLKENHAGIKKTSDKDYFLYVGKLAAAKNVALAIEAALKMGFNLKIAGKGREQSNYSELINNSTSIHKDKIQFLGEVKDQELASLYAGAKALIFPSQDEDFGIVPVEAMSFGIPVVAYRSGGVIETVVDSVTGVFFDKLELNQLIDAIKKVEKLIAKNKNLAIDCQTQARKFSKAIFKKEIEDFIKSHLAVKEKLN